MTPALRTLAVLRVLVPAGVALLASPQLRAEDIRRVRGRGRLRALRCAPPAWRRSRIRVGVMVDPNEYILTNEHVIENAADIIVRLSDARKFTARLMGRDP